MERRWRLRPWGGAWAHMQASTPLCWLLLDDDMRQCRAVQAVNAPADSSRTDWQGSSLLDAARPSRRASDQDQGAQPSRLYCSLCSGPHSLRWMTPPRTVLVVAKPDDAATLDAARQLQECAVTASPTDWAGSAARGTLRCSSSTSQASLALCRSHSRHSAPPTSTLSSALAAMARCCTSRRRLRAARVHLSSAFRSARSAL